MSNKSTKDKNWNRDDSGRPKFRAKTWGAKDKTRDSRFLRRNFKNSITGTTDEPR